MDKTVYKSVAPSVVAPITLAIELMVNVCLGALMVIRENYEILVKIKKANKKKKKKKKHFD